MELRKGRNTKTELNLSENKKEDYKRFFEAVFLNPLLKSYENKRVKTERFIYQPPYLKVTPSKDNLLKRLWMFEIKNIYFGREKL